MNILIYCIILIFGCISLLLAVRKRKVFSKNRQVMFPSKAAPIKSVTATAEYEMVLEHSNQLIKILSRLDDSLLAKIAISSCCAALLFIANVWLNYEQKSLMIIAVTITIFVMLLPAALRKFIIATKTKQIMNDLPMFIDLVAVCVQSGMTVESALIYTTNNFSKINDSLTVVMQRVISRAELNGLHNALKDLYHSIDAVEIKMFCSSLQQSAHFGTSVYEQLMALSKDMRELQLLAVEERISKLPAKLSIPIIFLVACPIMILLTAPQVMRLLADVQNF